MYINAVYLWECWATTEVREGVRTTEDVAEDVAIDTAKDIAGSPLLWTQPRSQGLSSYWFWLIPV